MAEMGVEEWELDGHCCGVPSVVVGEFVVALLEIVEGSVLVHPLV